MLTILFSDQISSPSFGTQQESKGIAPKLEVSYDLILVQCNTSPTRQQNGDRYQEYVDFSKTVWPKLLYPHPETPEIEEYREERKQGQSINEQINQTSMNLSPISWIVNELH